MAYGDSVEQLYHKDTYSPHRIAAVPFNSRRRSLTITDDGIESTAGHTEITRLNNSALCVTLCVTQAAHDDSGMNFGTPFDG